MPTSFPHALPRRAARRAACMCAGALAVPAAGLATHPLRRMRNRSRTPASRART
jgi:hypothetical protein